MGSQKNTCRPRTGSLPSSANSSTPITTVMPAPAAARPATSELGRLRAGFKLEHGRTSSGHGRRPACTGRSSTRRSARPWPRAVTDGDSRPLAITMQPVADLEQLVQLLADHQHGAAGVAQLQQLAADLRAAPTSTPQVGCDTISSFGLASISRPTMNFCRLPPDRLLAAAPGPPALTLKRSISRPPAAHARPLRSSRPRHRLGAREQRVVRQAQRGHGAAAQALLGHEVQAQRRRWRGDMRADVLAEQRHHAGRRAWSSPDSAAISSLLAVARHTGDAHDLAGAHLEAMSPAGPRRRVLRGRRQARTASTTAPGGAAAVLQRGGSAPIIRRDRLALVSCVGSTSPVTLPPRSTVQWWHSARISSSLWLM
jgi:hypothetical protein